MFKKVLILIVMAISITACSEPTPQAYDSQGNAIHLNDFKGKWLVLNVWGTWCKPCIEELPELNKLQQNYPEQVAVIGINFDGISNDEINQFIAPMNLQFAMVSQFPLKETLGIDKIRTVPMTFIIDPNGNLINTHHQPITATNLAKEIGIAHG